MHTGSGVKKRLRIPSYIFTYEQRQPWSYIKEHKLVIEGLLVQIPGGPGWVTITLGQGT